VNGWAGSLHLICVRRIIESPVLRGSSASKGLIELTMLILAVIVVVVVVVLVVAASVVFVVFAVDVGKADR
jgi:hypothetical protein